MLNFLFASVFLPCSGLFLPSPLNCCDLWSTKLAPLCSKAHQKHSHIHAAHSSPLQIERNVLFFWPSENKHSEHWFQKPISKAPGECLTPAFVWTWITWVFLLHCGCAHFDWRGWSRIVAQHLTRFSNAGLHLNHNTKFKFGGVQCCDVNWVTGDWQH